VIPELIMQETINKIKAGDISAYRQIKEVFTLDEDQERILQSMIQIQQ
jgi:hypothetical protein